MSSVSKVGQAAERLSDTHTELVRTVPAPGKVGASAEQRSELRTTAGAGGQTTMPSARQSESLLLLNMHVASAESGSTPAPIP